MALKNTKDLPFGDKDFLVTESGVQIL